MMQNVMHVQLLKRSQKWPAQSTPAQPKEHIRYGASVSCSSNFLERRAESLGIHKGRISEAFFWDLNPIDGFYEIIVCSSCCLNHLRFLTKTPKPPKTAAPPASSQRRLWAPCRC